MIAALAAVFAATFLAATVFPFQSELVFVGVQLSGLAPLAILVAVASLGNTLGAFVNYWIGGRLEDAGAHRWLRIDDRQFARARVWWERYGVWSLLLSWAPILGWFTVVAGAMRTPLWQFTLLVGIAKTGRFVLLGWLTAQAMGLDWAADAP
ncbi:YqaA family protein [Pararhodobacter sp. SW119]|uniref:YqaA family protein n=1 Tax=Pararhodobacter sp. SW119 TaxID=2780075 RepID=UPI001ADF9AE3|nr:YqaA family protein [Pararhodobacter sp. SW119]